MLVLIPVALMVSMVVIFSGMHGDPDSDARMSSYLAMDMWRHQAAQFDAATPEAGEVFPLGAISADPPPPQRAIAEWRGEVIAAGDGTGRRILLTWPAAYGTSAQYQTDDYARALSWLDGKITNDRRFTAGRYRADASGVSGRVGGVAIGATSVAIPDGAPVLVTFDDWEDR